MQLRLESRPVGMCWSCNATDGSWLGTKSIRCTLKSAIRRQDGDVGATRSSRVRRQQRTRRLVRLVQAARAKAET